MINRPELVRRAKEYAVKSGLVIADSLGAGVHGSVFATKGHIEAIHSAVKVHTSESAFHRERNAYLRLKECGVSQICGCKIPSLLRYDNNLWVLEMTLVTPPFVLDFGDANLDRPHDFSDEVLADWEAQKKELFERRWPDVLKIIRYLEGFGIYILDVNPGNICFGE
jgi:hypothetical protein